VHLELIGEPEATAWLDAKIEHLRGLARDPPPQYIPLGIGKLDRKGNLKMVPNPLYETWKNKFLMYYGKVLGAVDTMERYGILPPDACKNIESRVKEMLTVNMVMVSSGARLIG